MLVALVAAGPVSGQDKKEKAPKDSQIVVSAEREVIRFPFGDSRNQATRTFTLAADPPLSKKPQVRSELEGDLLTEDGKRIPPEQVTVTTKESSFSNVNVSIKLNPKGDAPVEPGDYTGTLTVGGQRIQPGVLTINATLRDAKSQALLWAILGALVGLFVKVAADRSRAAADAQMAAKQVEVAAATTKEARRPGSAVALTLPTAPRLKDYLKSAGFVSSAALGILGAVAAYALTYYENPTWGADSLDYWKLAAAAFAGVMTGASGADLVKPLVGKKR